jgi:uncharacterized protein RhaS with RHS repeats
MRKLLIAALMALIVLSPGPASGRFLSADPVSPDSNTGDNFNRYWYANNNPYKFTDPDGRFAFLAAPIVFGIGALLHSEPANAPAPRGALERTSPGEAMSAAIPVGKVVVPLKAAVETAGNLGQRAATREAKRQAGIPTSQQPSSQTNGRASDGTPLGRQQTYEVPKPGGGTQTMSVQVSRDVRGDHAGMPQIEAGPVKSSGEVGPGDRPRLQNGSKVRVDFEPAR